MAKLHSFLITTLRDQMPKFFNKEKQKARLIKNLPSIIEDLQTKHKLTLLDLPEVNRMQDKLKTANFRKFPKLNEKLLNQVNIVLLVIIESYNRQLSAYIKPKNCKIKTSYGSPEVPRFEMIFQ